MSKTLHSRHNKIYLDKLRRRRETLLLRQSDLADLLGRSQATVSKVERGELTLNVIELRDWLSVLGVSFIEFLAELDAELTPLGSTRLHMVSGKRARPRKSAAGRLLRNAVPGEE